MERMILKHKLLQKCLEVQQTLIDDFQERLQTLREGERLSNDEELDGGHLAQKVQMDAEVLALNDQLEFATNELRFLFELRDRLEDQPMAVVAPGAVVQTDRGTFFVSTSIEAFRVDGKKYFGLSVGSPLYHAMKGKTKGNSVSINGTTYIITDVF